MWRFGLVWKGVEIFMAACWKIYFSGWVIFCHISGWSSATYLGDLLPHIWAIFCHISGGSSVTYLEEMRIRLSQASFAELGLGLSLAIIFYLTQGFARTYFVPKYVKVWFGLERGRYFHFSGGSSTTYLEEMRIRLSQASFAELGLGLQGYCRIPAWLLVISID